MNPHGIHSIALARRRERTMIIHSSWYSHTIFLVRTQPGPKTKPAYRSVRPGIYCWNPRLTLNGGDCIRYPYREYAPAAQGMRDIFVSLCLINRLRTRCDPPLPAVKTHITVGFQPARNLAAGDNVTINLQASEGSYEAGRARNGGGGRGGLENTRAGHGSWAFG